MAMDKTRIDYDYDKKNGVRRSSNPALQRDIDDYNRNEAVELMKKKQAIKSGSTEDMIEQIRESKK